MAVLEPDVANLEQVARDDKMTSPYGSLIFWSWWNKKFTGSPRINNFRKSHDYYGHKPHLMEP